MDNQTPHRFRRRNRDLIFIMKTIRISKKCFHLYHRPRMDLVKWDFLAIFLCFAAGIVLSGCASDPLTVALEAKDWYVRRAAISDLTDQAALARVALEGRDQYDRQAAVEKLTDQTVLARVAIETKELSVGLSAIEKLTDKATIGKVALEAKELRVRLSAVEKLTDQSNLGKVSLDDKDWRVRIATVKKLEDQQLLAKIAAEDKSKFVRLASAARVYLQLASATRVPTFSESDLQTGYTILKVIPEFYSIPIEHSERIMENILPALRLLSDPEVIKEIGEIVSVKLDWSPMLKWYRDLNNYLKPMHGESLTFSIDLKNLPKPLSHSWSTYFLDTASANPANPLSLGFYPARIDVVDLLRLAFERFSKDLLAKIAADDTIDFNIRKAVQKRIDAR